MSAVKGTHYTLYDAGTLLDPGEWGGGILVSYDKYEASALTTGSTISMCVIPAGARILPESRLMTDDLGTGVTIAVGDGDDTDEYLTATSVAAASNTTFNVLDNLGEPITAAETMTLTTAGGNITGTIKLWVYYTLN
jgi:hypothetical protein